MPNALKKVPTPVWIALAAVAAYLGYKWWHNRQSQGLGPGVPQLGTNLNSIAPELIGGSAGPNSGLTYNEAPINVTLTQPIAPAPVSNAHQSGPSKPPLPVPPITFHPGSAVTMKGLPVVAPLRKLTKNGAK